MILQVIAVFDAPGAPPPVAAILTLAAWLFGLAVGFAIVSLFAYGV